MTNTKTIRDVWTIRDGVTLNAYGVMGIVNVTPDSFYDLGLYGQSEAALTHARNLWHEGAHILDLGAESSRPGADPISSKEELRRLMPVLEPLMKELNAARSKKTQTKHVPYISVDTYHAKTAKAALEAGVHIINDISACVFEPELLEVVAHYKPGYVLMHSSGTPKTMQEKITYDNIIDDLRLFFEFHLERLIKAGLPESNIVFDLGIGFGKTFEQNLEILNNLHKFQGFASPILIGISMKSFLSTLLQLDKKDFTMRAQATQTITAILAAQGFGLHRVHHVADTLTTLNIVYNFKPSTKVLWKQ